MVFCSHAAISLWFLSVFSIFGSDFFLSGFSNPFVVHSWPSFFFEPNFQFQLMVFCSHSAFLHWFSIFIWFFKKCFPNSLIVHSRSSFLFSQWKFFELCVRTCPVMFFVLSSDALFRFTFVHSAKLKKSNFLNDFFLSLTAFACVTSFLTLFSKSFLRD